MQIKINRNVILALNLIASRDESRYVLNGVCFEVTPATKTKPAKCNVIATDGRRLMAAQAGEVIIPPDKKTSAILRVNVPMIKALPKSEVISGDVVITFGEKSATIQAYGVKGVSCECELIEGDFPKWRQVVPTGEMASPIDPCFNWRYLEGFIKAAEMISGKNGNGVRLRQADPLNAMLVLFPDIPYMVGVLMPMNGNNRNSAPDWATEEAVEVPEATQPVAQAEPTTAAVANPA